MNHPLTFKLPSLPGRRALPGQPAPPGPRRPARLPGRQLAGRWLARRRAALLRLLLHPRGAGQWLLGSLGWTAGALTISLGLGRLGQLAGPGGLRGALLLGGVAAWLLLWAQVLPRGRQLPAWAALPGPGWLKLLAYTWLGAQLLLHIHWGLLGAWLVLLTLRETGAAPARASPAARPAP